jgi:phospholipid/cholesterol/gamma-HCH transport system permease protein
VTSARNGIQVEDIIGGIIKPFFFGLVIGSVACNKGLNTTGGTVGVGRSTTDAVVIASIWVIIFDFFLSKALQFFLGIDRI